MQHFSLDQGSQGLSAILCPLTPSEIPNALENLGRWVNHCPPFQPSSPDLPAECDLIFVFSNLSDDAMNLFLADITTAWPIVNKWFRNIVAISPKLSQEDDMYATLRPGLTPRFGTKSGPNLIFFYSLLYCMERYQGFFLLMETDCTPVRSGWADALDRHCRSSPHMWILGSTYHGTSLLPSHLSRHINGNALYNVGNTEFQLFINSIYLRWFSYWVERVDRAIAYDCGWEEFIRDANESATYVRLIGRYFQRRIGSTPLILNISGEDEKQGRTKWSAEDVTALAPDVMLVHGLIADAAGRPVKHPLAEDRLTQALEELSRRYSASSEESGLEFGNLETIGEVTVRDGGILSFRRVGNTHGVLFPFRLRRRSFVPGDRIYARIVIEPSQPIRIAALLCRHGPGKFEGFVRRRLRLARTARTIWVVHRVRSPHDKFRVHLYLEPDCPSAQVTITSLRVFAKPAGGSEPAEFLISEDQRRVPAIYGYPYIGPLVTVPSFNEDSGVCI